jgi:serine/threonine-protein phosphatase 2B catalytic subunit
MMKMYKTLREENETIMQLKGLAPDNKVPRGLLGAGSGALKDQVEQFKNAKDLDSVNEKMPEM